MHSKACGARTRGGHPCKSASMGNGRCRMHGGTNPGAPRGNRNAWKHGGYGREQLIHRQEVRQLLDRLKSLASGDDHD